MILKLKILALIILWLAYGIWEYYVHKWAETQHGAIIRVDIILFIPVLIGLTIWVLVGVYKEYYKR